MRRRAGVWCDTIGRTQDIEPLFVAVLDARDQPLLLLRLGIARSRGLRILGFLDGTVSDLNAPVIFEPARHWDRATIERVWNDIKKQLPRCDVACLQKLPEQVDGWTNPLWHLATATSSQGASWMALPRNWDESAKHLLPNPVDSRRRTRKLARLGQVSFCIARSSEEALGYLEAAMEMKGRKLAGTIGIDRFTAEPGYADYYAEITRMMFHTGAVHAAALKLDDTIISAHWG